MFELKRGKPLKAAITIAVLKSDKLITQTFKALICYSKKNYVSNQSICS